MGLPAQTRTWSPPRTGRPGGVGRATIRHVSRQVEGLIRLQLASGIRPGEAVKLASNQPSTRQRASLPKRETQPFFFVLLRIGSTYAKPRFL